MRQSGILAAAGLIALEEMPKRLHEDHANAAYFAKSLTSMPGVKVVPPRTNIVIFDIAGTGIAVTDLSARLKEQGVLINPVTPTGTAMRAVTHYDVDRAGCEKAIGALTAALAGSPVTA